ncbi:MAG: hypothetical protein IJX05_00445 [Clostridia bacterium]|nr:hypothetical protein [Clostridia bacterium]
MNILNELYHGNINESARSIKDLQNTEEYKRMDESYKKLQEALTNEQKTLFEEFYDHDGDFVGLENERSYANGVRTGMLLALSLLDFST